MPGFGPAAEVLLFRQKDPKPLMLSLVVLHEAGARIRWGGPTRCAHTRAARMERPSSEASLQASEG